MSTRALSTMQVSIKDEGVFVPMIADKASGIPIPVAGAASRSHEDAEARVRVMMQNPFFVKGWVISRDEITEIIVD